MERSGFYDAFQTSPGEYDRVYLAEAFASYFASFVGNGVFLKESTQLQVLEAPGQKQNKVIVSLGKAWFDGYWYENTDSLTKDIDPADGVLDRIDSVVVRFGTAERDGWIEVIKGVAGSEPIAPAPVRSADYNDLVIAHVTIPAGSTGVQQSQIEDTRGISDICGWVHALFEQVDTTTIYNQFTAYLEEFKANGTADFEEWSEQQKAAFLVWEQMQKDGFESWSEDQKKVFDEWFASIQGILSGDVAAKLTAEIEKLKEAKPNATATYSNGVVQIVTVPVNAKNIYFYAPSDFKESDTYTINGRLLTITDLNNQPIYDAWKNGSPISLIIKDNVGFFKFSGGSISDTLPPMVTNLKAQPRDKEISVTWNNVDTLSDKVSVSGEIISVDDVSPITHTVGCRVESKNLLDRNTKPYTKRGITFTPVLDSHGNIDYIDVDGTAEGNADNYLTEAVGYKFRLDKGRTVTMSIESDIPKAKATLQSDDYSWALETTKESPVKTGKTRHELFGCWLRIPAGTVVSHGKVKVQLEYGSDATPYTPHVLDFTKTNVLISNQNLINDNPFGYLFKKEADGSYKATNIVSQNNSMRTVNLPAHVYTVSLDIKCAIGENYRLYVVYSDDSMQVGEPIISTGDYLHQKMITTGQPIKAICFSHSQYGDDVSFKNLQIVPGDTDLPYKKQEKSVYTPLSDGIVQGVVSLSPDMTVLSDTPGVFIDVEYAKSILAGVVITYNTDHIPKRLSDGKKIDAGLAERVHIDSLANGTEVFIRVFPYNSKRQYQTMIDGAVVSAIPAEGPLPATNLQVSLSGTSASISWLNSTDPTFDTVVVVQNESSAPVNISDGKEIYKGKGTTVTATKLKANIQYYWGVFSLNATGGYRAPLVSAPYSYGLPQNVTELMVEGAGSIPTIKWTNPPVTEVFKEIVVTQSQDVPVTTIEEGTVIYRGSGTSAKGQNLKRLVNYYWTVFVVTTEGEYRKPVSTAEAYSYDITKVLDENSWETISDVAKEGKGELYWKVGDTKETSVNGTVGNYKFSGNQYPFILGFNHNEALEGRGIHMSFGKSALTGGKDIAYQGFEMNKSDVNSGGWNSSLMRTQTCKQFYDILPTDLKSAIAECTKYTDNTGGGLNVASYVTATQDRIFILAEFETFGKRSYANSSEMNKQKQYEYYRLGNDKIRYDAKASEKVVYTWLRSPYFSLSDYFCSVGKNGLAYVNTASDVGAFAPAFKL